MTNCQKIKWNLNGPIPQPSIQMLRFKGLHDDRAHVVPLPAREREERHKSSADLGHTSAEEFAFPALFQQPKNNFEIWNEIFELKK